ncbi:MAG: hypothetical protein ACKV2T_03995 [Kofleriaceae bacterium]
MRRLGFLVFAAACGDGSSTVDAPPDPDARPVDLSCLSTADHTATERRVLEMPADSWMQLADSALDPWCRTRGLPENGEPTAYRCGGVVTAWGGGAFDSSLRQLILFGGGHNDYAGNEVYGFDMASGAWQLLVPPTPMALVRASVDEYADGTPVSRHSYDNFAYMPDRAQLLVFGGSRYQDGSTTNVTWTLDSGGLAWTKKSKFELGGLFYTGSDYDEATGRVFMRSEDGLFTYDVAGDQWSRVLDFGYPPYYPTFSTSNARRGVVVPERRLFFMLGGETQAGDLDFLVWDVGAARDATADWATTGDASGVRVGGTGADYDRAGDAIVTWSGGGPNILDLRTRVWRRGSGTGAPADQVQNGTYGRWRYVAYLNAFVLVNEPTENVWIYKHTGGCG